MLGYKTNRDWIRLCVKRVQNMKKDHNNTRALNDKLKDGQ